MSTTHSKIGASSMHRWAACPGSVRLSKDIPNTSSKYAEEGTLAHDLAADLLNLELRGNDGGDIADFHAKWTDIDPEMHENVKIYVEEFLKEAFATPGWFSVERKFNLSNLHPGLFGTADGIIYQESIKVLQVWDFKYGQGIPVEPENNEQLMYYGLGALMETKAPCSDVELVICQPRCPHPEGPIRKWRLSVTDLIDFAADLIDAAKRTEDPNAGLVPGDHCRFCPASPTCPQLHDTAVELAKNEFSPAFSYDPAKLASVLELIPAIKAWAKSVEEFAHGEAQHGRVPPGYKLVPKRAMRKWRDEEQAAEAIHKLGIETSLTHKPAVLKSPAQIEDVLDKKQKLEIAEYIIKESSGSNLVPFSDKRPQTVPAVETEFTKIEEDIFA